MTLHALPRPLLGLLVMLVWLAGCATPGEPPTPDTNPAETAFQRGVAALTRGSYDQAITAFTETLTLTPNRVEAYHNRGEAYRLKGDYDQALADYTQALSLNPDYAKAYYARGIVHSNKGDYDEALADYTQALTLNQSLSQRPTSTVALPMIVASVTMTAPLPTTIKPSCLIRSAPMPI